MSTGQALVLGVVVVGCSTAGLITGHLSSADFMTLTGVTIGAGGAVTAAHVGGSVATGAQTVTAGGPPSPPAVTIPDRPVPAAAQANGAVGEPNLAAPRTV